MSFSESDFAEFMNRLALPETVDSLCVAVSGGPDSMALCHALSVWAGDRGIEIHAVTVDHGLRDEAAKEAADVGAAISAWKNVTHKILRWEGEKPETRILEEARAARYSLIENHMKESGTGHLFVAHHQDDQAETFLIRLAKGSGLDGLAAMLPLQKKEDGITLCRPLLGCSKDDLIGYCQNNGISFVDDPTNKNEKYLRPRLRAARDILDEEGLSSKRLAVTAARMARARQALEMLSDRLFAKALVQEKSEAIELSWSDLAEQPEELILRVLSMAVDKLQPERDYAPRMGRMEQLLARLCHDADFKGATLGGCMFALDRRKGALYIRKEQV